jgi:hypothetical protein
MTVASPYLDVVSMARFASQVPALVLQRDAIEMGSE